MIRLATPADAAAMAALYAPCVTDTAISFELVPPSADEMAARVARTLPRWPWLVREEGGELLGYAYAGPFAERPCYRWSVTTSVYVHPGHHRRGIGRGLYAALLGLLAEQGFRSAYAGITLPNEASMHLHRSMGFTPVGVYHDAGHKLGRWHDVARVQRALQPGAARAEPQPPEPLEATAVFAHQHPLWDDTEWAGAS